MTNVESCGAGEVDAAVMVKMLQVPEGARWWCSVGKKKLQATAQLDRAADLLYNGLFTVQKMSQKRRLRVRIYAWASMAYTKDRSFGCLWKQVHGEQLVKASGVIQSFTL